MFSENSKLYNEYQWWVCLLESGKMQIIDRFFISRYYHCFGFNHFTKNCPDKDKLSICAKCAIEQTTKNCRESIEKCISCYRHQPSQRNDHCSFSNHCSIFVLERNVLARTTDFNGEKN